MFTDTEVEVLKGFVSDPTGNVFVVFPSAMPGMIGAAYARYSRAKGGFKETLLREFIKAGQLDHARADTLIQRILIQYGDDSVQELESAWLSLEQISNIAAKAIEDRRLAAYIEQSSRYVFYDERDNSGRFRYYQEPAIMASGHARRYEEVMDFVFGTYCRLIEPMQEYFKHRKPLEVAKYEIRAGRGQIHYSDCRDAAERRDFERTWRSDIRAKTCDTLRILLPAATLTNVGVHANGRSFEHMLRHLYSSDLAELQRLAVQAHLALNTVIPRYVQRAGRSDYLVETRSNMQRLADELLAGVPVKETAMVDLLPEFPCCDLRLATMLYPYTLHSLCQLEWVVHNLSYTVKQKIVDTYIGDRRGNRRNRPGRALEYGYRWNIDLVVDFGIFRDLHRHRMLTQERQIISTRLGFCEIPEEIVEAGFEEDVRACVEMVIPLYEAIRADLGREIAQYPVLFGFNMRSYRGLNDRAAQHLLELRTQRQGHRSYRRVCQEIYRQMKVRDPYWVERVFEFVDLADYDWPRADSEARQRLKETKLSG